MDLAYLADLSPKEFELERMKIINEHLDSLPHEQRAKMLAFQIGLDVKREQMAAEEFMAYLVRQMGENFENMSDLVIAARHQLGHTP
jgi:hypothetical protein